MSTLAKWHELKPHQKVRALDRALRLEPRQYRRGFASQIRENSHVVDAIVREIRGVRDWGRTRYSMRTIFEILRHHSMVRDGTTDQFKLNGNLAPDCARLMMALFPVELDGFFHVRDGSARTGERAA